MKKRLIQAFSIKIQTVKKSILFGHQQRNNKQNGYQPGGGRNGYY